jgi:glutamate dehydrogenase (NAD(P)+)
VIGVECDIWIPAARPNVLHVDNVDTLRSRLVAQGANIPATAEAEARLHERGILSLPDFIANAGGVICGAVEYAGGSQTEAFATSDERIRANTAQMLDRATLTGVLPRQAATEMALDRLHAAMSTRRFR